MHRRSTLFSFLRISACASLVCAGVLALAGTVGAAGTHSANHTPPPPFSGPPGPPARPHGLDIYATYYGWYTNTPPGCQTAYTVDNRQHCAQGIGTFTDPITFASAPKEFPVGTILYYPTVRKYFVMQDLCTTCNLEWTTVGPNGGPGFRQVDLWIGGTGGTEFAEINCEDALTQSTSTGAPQLTTFIENPPRHLPVSHEPLFNVRTNGCFGGAHSTPTYGQYKNKTSGKCLEDPTASGAPGTAAEVATCSAGAAGEDIGFEGDFLMVNNLCLAMTTKTPTATTTSGLEWTTCTGGSREQWEVASTGPIEWIQYIRCVVQTGSGKTTLKMSACTFKTPPPADQTWTFTKTT